MGIILWVIFGALVGWIASMIMQTDEEQGSLLNIVVGIVGALLGGWVMNVFGQAGVTGFNIYSLIVAIIGSVILLAIVRALQQTGRKYPPV
ncbi:MAG: GlsB/YeaQ/YmgE family stress response membrane protein [Patescibacteria group bacterium]|mgnify:CR=1 FL=1